jgi:hypothetical protein
MIFEWEDELGVFLAETLGTEINNREAKKNFI